MPNILVAIPAYGGSIKMACAESLLRLQEHFLKSDDGLGWHHLTIDCGDIALARNVLANHFLQKTEHSHILFIDSDMAFSPNVIDVMIDQDKPFIGCAYPTRQIDLSRAMSRFAATGNERAAIASALHFTAGHIADNDGLIKVEVNNNAFKASSVGMGLTLIKREVFSALAGTERLTVHKHHPAMGAANYPILGFFDTMNVNGSLLLEDASFCQRWRALCGGEVWAYVGATIGHIGDFNFSGCYGDKLSAGMV